MSMTRPQIIAAIGEAICWAGNDRPAAGAVHRCKSSLTGVCVQMASGGGECMATRQARAVVDLLETEQGDDLIESIRHGAGRL